VQLHKDVRRFSKRLFSDRGGRRTHHVCGAPQPCETRYFSRTAEPNWSAARKRPMWNHPRQSPTISLSSAYFPVFSSPTATIEVVGNTGNMSSEKAGVGGSTPSMNLHPPAWNLGESWQPQSPDGSSRYKQTLFEDFSSVSSFGVLTFIFASRTFIICAHPHHSSGAVFAGHVAVLLAEQSKAPARRRGEVLLGTIRWPREGISKVWVVATRIPS
jgi:hypothetical protein